MSVPENVVSDRSIAVPLSPAGVAAPGTYAPAVARRSGLGVRAWFLTALLFLVPVVTYWPATFHEFGLRDDYSNLREAHEEPGTVIKFCASHARPIYGWLLQSTYGQANSVHDLQWLRFGAALLLGALSLVAFRGFRALGWSFRSSLCYALLLALIPSSQVIAGWAVGWPYVATALLAMCAFLTAEGALNGMFPAGVGRFAAREAADGIAAGPAHGTRRRAAGQWALALALVVVSALIYQPSALFYVVPLAAALIVRRERSVRETARWAGLHLGMFAGGLALAYAIMSALYSSGVFVKSNRIAFEHHWGDKIMWFLSEPLPNALSLFVINDNNGRDHGWYYLCAALVGTILLAGAWLEWRRHGRGRGLVWLTALLGLPVFAFAVSMLASERYATYRTILAMTAVLLCFLVASVRALTDSLEPRIRRILATSALTVAFLTAQHHAYALIAVPQGKEWQLILSGAKHTHLTPSSHPRVFAIMSSPADISTATIYHDEFGSLSTNSEWVPKEMFKRAMHDLHPGLPNLESRYDFSEGPRLPADQHYDVIVDLHRLKQFRTEN